MSSGRTGAPGVREGNTERVRAENIKAGKWSPVHGRSEKQSKLAAKIKLEWKI
jgi:hypothetical protein